jgi:predicted anti-sigma-YlaC factor YlaD
MNCNRCEELISDYLEGALGQSERNSMELHLGTCADCSQLATGIAQVLEWGKAFPVYEPSSQLHTRIVTNTPRMHCAQCEELLSDYLEGRLATQNLADVDVHLESCSACSNLLANMGKVLEWGKRFPVYPVPAWLPARIIANTPRIERERWVDTFAGAWKWIRDPRAAVGLFTATLVLSWMGSLAGISPNWTTVVRNPTSIYYEAQGAVNRAYDEAIRTYYRSPLVTEIRTRIEQLREIS